MKKFLFVPFNKKKEYHDLRYFNSEFYGLISISGIVNFYSDVKITIDQSTQYSYGHRINPYYSHNSSPSISLKIENIDSNTYNSLSNWIESIYNDISGQINPIGGTKKNISIFWRERNIDLILYGCLITSYENNFLSREESDNFLEINLISDYAQILT